MTLVTSRRLRAGFRRDCKTSWALLAAPSFDRLTSFMRLLTPNQPFEDREHGPSTYLTATFVKRALDPVPASVDALGYDASARAVLAVSDNTATKTPGLMGWLKRNFTKDITTRTWLTVHSIVRKTTN